MNITKPKGRCEIKMKKIKKSEIALYAISLMLVTAGYFNYSMFKPKIKETTAEEVIEQKEQYANVGDAVLVSNNEIQNEIKEEKIEVEEKADYQKQEIKEENEENKNLEQEDKNKENYFANSRLERNVMFAEMIASYQEILNNKNASEVQKSIATEEIKKINNSKNAIMICENLIKTKGFEECVILKNDDNINVIVEVKDGLNKENVAKLQNIVSREMKTEISNIHITEN